MNFIKNIGFINKMLLNSKLQSLPEDMENMIASADKHNLICNAPIKDKQCLRADAFIEQEYYIFKDVVDDKTSYNVFYDNIHIRMEYSDNSHVYSVHLKKVNDTWCFNLREDDTVDHSHPSTQTYRVYVAYDVPILDITNATGASYVEGKWDNYVYKTLNILINSINNLTDATQFNNEYSKL